MTVSSITPSWLLSVPPIMLHEVFFSWSCPWMMMFLSSIVWASFTSFCDWKKS